MQLKVTKTNYSLGEALVVVQILLFTGFERTLEVQRLLGCLQYIDKTTRNDYITITGTNVLHESS